jgi:Cys-tRNA(Pro)/Cys-tRNA(Cys) deacylase
VTDTPGIRAAEAAGLAFEVMRTERPSSAEESAAVQGIELGQLLRTIVIRRGADDYVFVLVPGGRQIDCPKLRAHLGVKPSLCRTPKPGTEERLRETATTLGTRPRQA